VDYISSTEGIDYPFYTVQYHPERNLYEFSKENVPHEPYAEELTTLLAEKFVQEAMKNLNKFDDFDKFVSYSLERNGILETSTEDPDEISSDYYFIYDYP
jgi:hypothetical protein